TLHRQMATVCESLVTSDAAETTLDPARRVAVGQQLELPRRITIQQVIPENALFDHRRRAGRQAFVIKGARAKAARTEPVVEDGDVLAGYALADFSGQKRSVAINRVAANRFEQMPQERPRCFGIKDDRYAAGGNLASTQFAEYPLRRFPTNFSRVFKRPGAPGN